MVPLIHGFWKQRSLALFGRTLTLTLLARRSKHFAGTRFRKRGVSNSGCVRGRRPPSLKRGARLMRNRTYGFRV